MGGWDYDYLDSSESVDLLAGGGGSCSRSLRDLPEPVEYNLGLSRPSDGAPMSCGGITFSGGTKGARSCWVYRQALDEWVEGPEMVTPRPSGAQVECHTVECVKGHIENIQKGLFSRRL